jgi:hypothetical protein
MNKLVMFSVVVATFLLLQFSFVGAASTSFPCTGAVTGTATFSCGSTGNVITNQTIDIGQSTLVTVNDITGGIGPYTANFILSNTLTANVANTLTIGFAAGNSITLLVNSVTTSGFNLWITTNSGTYLGPVAVTGTNSLSSPWTINAVVHDTLANTLTTNGIPILTIDPPLTVSISPASNTLDAGQQLPLTTTVGGGAPSFAIAYTGNGLCGTLSATSNTLGADGSNTIVFIPNSATTVAGCTATLTATVTDSASTNTIVANTLSLTVNSIPTATLLTPSNVLLDSGQTVTYNVLLAGGTGAFTANLVASNGVVVNSITGALAGTVTFGVQTPPVGASDSYNVMATDTGTSTPFAFNSISNTITVNSIPTATLLTPSNAILDLGQYETYNVLASGGTGPFTFNLIYVSGPSGATVKNLGPGNVVETMSGLSQGAPYWSNFNSFSTNGLYAFNAILTDTGTSTPYIFNSVSNTITVNPAMVSSISPTSNTLDAGQSLSLATTVSGGTPSYTIAYTLSAAICGTRSATSNTLGAAGTNTITFTSNSALSSTTCTLTETTTDSASTHNVIASSSTLTIGTIPTISITADSSRTGPGFSIAYTGNIPSGTGKGPFTVNLIVSGAVAGNMIIPAGGGSNTISYTFGSTGTFSISMTATDTGASTPYTFSSSSVSATVANPSYATGGGYVNSVPPTTTISTTTVPQHTLNQSGTAKLNVSSKSPGIFNYSDGLVLFNITTNSSGTVGVLLIVGNVTSSSPNAPSNYTKLIAVNVSINSTNAFVYVTIKYNCNVPSNRVTPFILRNGTWVAITPFTVNATACTVSFAVPRDPVVALFETPAPPTTTTLPITTVPTTVIQNTTTPSTSSNSTSISSLAIAAVVIVVIVVIAAAYYVLRMRKPKSRSRS